MKLSQDTAAIATWPIASVAADGTTRYVDVNRIYLALTHSCWFAGAENIQRDAGIATVIAGPQIL